MSNPVLNFGGLVEFLALMLLLGICAAFLDVVLVHVVAAALSKKPGEVDPLYRSISRGFLFVLAWLVGGLAHLNALDIVVPLQFREAQQVAWDWTGTFLMALAGVGAGVLLSCWIARRSSKGG